MDCVAALEIGGKTLILWINLHAVGLLSCKMIDGKNSNVRQTEE
jgi:hypothetical protein